MPQFSFFLFWALSLPVHALTKAPTWSESNTMPSVMPFCNPFSNSLCLGSLIGSSLSSFDWGSSLRTTWTSLISLVHPLFQTKISLVYVSSCYSPLVLKITFSKFMSLIVTSLCISFGDYPPICNSKHLPFIIFYPIDWRHTRLFLLTPRCDITVTSSDITCSDSVLASGVLPTSTISTLFLGPSDNTGEMPLW
jgi:hypothetical protein